MKRSHRAAYTSACAAFLLCLGVAAQGQTFLTVTTLVDENNGGLGVGLGDSLRECLVEANGGAGDYNISFAGTLFASGPKQITITSALSHTSANTVEVIGPGANRLTIRNVGFDRIFDVNGSGEFHIEGLTVAEGLVFTEGGGIFVRSGSTLSMLDCGVRDCLALNGGGIYVDIGATADIRNSELSGNTATSLGGGVFVLGPVDIENSTISDNRADIGGGIHVANNAGAISRFIGCTVANNEAVTSGGGMSFLPPVELHLVGNCIIARNTSPGLPDLFQGGLVDNLGNNIIGVGNGLGNFVDGINGDQVGTVAVPLDPLLGPLGFYGGGTRSHGLLVSSPALDAGNPALIGVGITTDQRGAPAVREFGTVDVGAYEAQDYDGDGVADTIENSVPSLASSIYQPTGDGNGDNIIESSTDMQASLPSESAAGPVFTRAQTRGVVAGVSDYITIVASANTYFRNVAASSNPAANPTILDPTEFPLGFVIFDQHVQNPGDPGQVNVFYENPLPASAVAYFKVGQTAVRPNEHLYRFDYFGSGTGAVFLVPPTTEVILLLRDGATGDNDLVADGVIRDPGGPGVDNPLYVDLVSFGASASDYGLPVTVRWETAAEVNNVGFNIYTATVDGDGKLVPGPLANASLIGAEGSELEGAVYTFIDPVPLADGEARYYVLEDIDSGGLRTHHGPALVVVTKDATNVQEWMIIGE